MWDTSRYKNDAWYKNGKQPFVYSFGDGYVIHTYPPNLPQTQM